MEAENFYLQATAYHDNGELENAADYYSEAVNANPSYAKAWFNLALVHYDLGNFSKAELALEKLMEIDPADKSIFELYGLTQYQRGHFDRAIASYNVVLETAGASEMIRMPCSSHSWSSSSE